MDAKTAVKIDKKIAVEILRDKCIDYVPVIVGMKPISIRRCNEIADFIEQQATMIGKMRNCWNCKYSILYSHWERRCGKNITKCQGKHWQWDGGSGDGEQ